jgi:anti-sigma factor RsiW
MTCREVVELMTEYLEGTLSPAQRVRFEEHLAGCDGCTTYLEQMRTTMRLLGRIAEEPMPASMEAELVRAFRDWSSGAS